MKKITYLDCTFRDGGYYNNWDFSRQKAKEIIDSLNKAKVDIIEVGYKSKRSDKYSGLFKYCNENYLEFLKKEDYSKYAFMIDVKEFIVSNKIDYDSLDDLILHSNKSLFTWVRLATHYATIDHLKEFIGYFRNRGYKVAFNIMGVSLLTEEMLVKALLIANQNKVDSFYIADSFGSFYPSDIRRLVQLCKKYYSGNIGMHAHDNQGLAYYNTLAAIEEGVTFIDGTITGMGRGAGNLKTEQFLLGKDFINGDQNKRNLNSLLKVIESFFNPLKEKYKWGYSHSYMFSGINNIHQSYCQNLQELNRFSIEEIGIILNNIPPENKSKFDKEVLEKSIQFYLSSHIQDKESKRIRHLKFKSSDMSDKILVAARGNTLTKYQYDIIRKIDIESLDLIEINETKIFDDVSNRLTVILNKHKLKSFLLKNEFIQNTIITGQEYINESIYQTVLRSLPYSIGSASIENDKISIPDYDAGIFGILIALLKKPKVLYLAGFDGTVNQEKYKVIDTFFIWLTNYCNQNSIEISIITPTKYNNIKESSIYSYS
jgi:4-hydroxy 2-oxovalerate aldolase